MVEEIIADIAGNFRTTMVVVDAGESPEISRFNMALEYLIGLNHGHGQFSAAIFTEITEQSIPSLHSLPLLPKTPPDPASELSQMCWNGLKQRGNRFINEHGIQHLSENLTQTLSQNRKTQGTQHFSDRIRFRK